MPRFPLRKASCPPARNLINLWRRCAGSGYMITHTRWLTIDFSDGSLPSHCKMRAAGSVCWCKHDFCLWSWGLAHPCLGHLSAISNLSTLPSPATLFPAVISLLFDYAKMKGYNFISLLTKVHAWLELNFISVPTQLKCFCTATTQHPAGLLWRATIWEVHFNSLLTFKRLTSTFQLSLITSHFNCLLIASYTYYNRYSWNP